MADPGDVAVTPTLDDPVPYCELRDPPMPVLPPGLGIDRTRAILLTRNKWANGTVLHYYFFDRDTDGSNVRFTDGSTRFVTWQGDEANKDVVRQAFATWASVGIGLRFVEVDDRSEAEVRIGFQRGDGSWSYVGRDILEQGMNERTMNFGWDLTRDAHGRTTALHEIGHTLDMPHEHQNPFAGIVWDEEAVYTYLGGPPNNWPRETTFHNVLRKLSQAEVSGSTWDPDSIMEYAFPAGLIRQPAKFQTTPLDPPGTLSATDIEFVRQWYPPLGPTAPPTLNPFESRAVSIKAGQQVDFVLRPPASREYDIGTFGAADTVLVVFEDVGGSPQFLAGDDDSGEERNALVRLKLLEGRTYIVRVRLYSAWRSGDFAVMYW